MSPLPTPAAHNAACSATVPEANATAHDASVTAHNAASKRSIAGPWVSQSPRSTSTTAAMSASSIVWRPYGMSIIVACTGQAASTERSSSIESHSSLVLLAYSKSSSTGLPTAVGPSSSHHGCSGITRYTSPASMACRALVGGDQQLVQLLAGADADHVTGRAGCDRLGEIGHAHRRDLRDEHLAALHVLERVEHEIDGLGERDPEPGHALVGDRDAAVALELVRGNTGTTEPREPTTLP